jgi:hypothetical protein
MSEFTQRPQYFFCHLDFQEFYDLYVSLKCVLKSISKLYQIDNYSFEKLKKIESIHNCVMTLIEESEDNIFDYEDNNKIDDIEEIYYFVTSNIDNFVCESNELIKFINETYKCNLHKIIGIHIEQQVKQSYMAGADLEITQKYHLKFNK